MHLPPCWPLPQPCVLDPRENRQPSGVAESRNQLDPQWQGSPPELPVNWKRPDEPD